MQLATRNKCSRSHPTFCYTPEQSQPNITSRSRQGRGPRSVLAGQHMVQQERGFMADDQGTVQHINVLHYCWPMASRICHHRSPQSNLGVAAPVPMSCSRTTRRSGAQQHGCVIDRLCHNSATLHQVLLVVHAEQSCYSTRQTGRPGCRWYRFCPWQTVPGGPRPPP